MSIPEALYIVSQNAQGVKHNYWDEYLPAILLVNETWPIVGYRTIEEEDGHELDVVEYRQAQNERYDRFHQV